jgi:hypothetical protein
LVWGAGCPCTLFEDATREVVVRRRIHSYFLDATRIATAPGGKKRGRNSSVCA